MLVENPSKVVNTAVNATDSTEDTESIDTGNVDSTEGTDGVTGEEETGGDEQPQPQNLEGDQPGKKKSFFIINGILPDIVSQ